MTRCHRPVKHGIHFAKAELCCTMRCELSENRVPIPRILLRTQQGAHVVDELARLDIHYRPRRSQ